MSRGGSDADHSRGAPVWLRRRNPTDAASDSAVHSERALDARVVNIFRPRLCVSRTSFIIRSSCIVARTRSRHNSRMAQRLQQQKGPGKSGAFQRIVLLEHRLFDSRKGILLTLSTELRPSTRIADKRLHLQHGARDLRSSRFVLPKCLHGITWKKS